MFLKNVSQKILCPKKFLVPKIGCRFNCWAKQFLSKKMLGSNKLFPWKNMGPEKILATKKYRSQKTLGPKIFWIPKKFGSQKNLVLKKFWVLKKNWVLNQFGFLKLFVKISSSKIILSQKKNFGPKKFWSQKIWVLKRF